MFRSQKGHEETVQVINESTTSRGSGGIGVITEGSRTDVKMLILPDDSIYKEDRNGGFQQIEQLFAHISKEEIDKISLITGKTKVIWNGNTYRVVGIIDMTTKPRFRNAEIRMVRKTDVI
jgi:hypothetical protein